VCLIRIAPEAPRVAHTVPCRARTVAGTCLEPRGRDMVPVRRPRYPGNRYVASQPGRAAGAVTATATMHSSLAGQSRTGDDVMVMMQGSEDHR
jgi:hypothetical protein